MESRCCSRPERAIAFTVAFSCAVLALGWQGATVRVNYGGDWSALFTAGERQAAPPAFEPERTYRFKHIPGYDGQYYHYIAHDPFLRRGAKSYVDAPRLRYRRILVPLLAWLAAAGRAEWVDRAYFAVVLAWVFSGAWWLTRLALWAGRSALWGFGFLAVPAVTISLDRMTVDIALAALCVAFALYVAEHRSARMLAVLALAPLARETGIVLVAAVCLCEVLGRRLGRAMLMASAAIPALAWYAYVSARTAPYTAEWLGLPFSGILSRCFESRHYRFSPVLSAVAIGLDYLALAGVLAALVAAFVLARRALHDPIESAALMFACLGVFLGRADVWQDAYGFSRVLTPLLLLPALRGLQSAGWIWMAPLAMVEVRVVAQLGPQILGVLGFTS